MIACKAIIMAAFCLSATLAATHFSQCDEKYPVPLELRIEGCTAEPCLLYNGKDVKAEWDFVVVADTKNLEAKVELKVGGLPVPHKLPEPDACKSLTNGECPLDQNETLTYSLQMAIKQAYPPIPLELKFTLEDGSGNVHVCFKIHAKVVKA